MEVTVENPCLLSELRFPIAVKILVGKGIWTQKCEGSNLGHLEDCSQSQAHRKKNLKCLGFLEIPHLQLSKQARSCQSSGYYM